ncbi:MAG: hypothetical protein WCD86_18170 [Ktedonobacteraceae bacterium]
MTTRHEISLADRAEPYIEGMVGLLKTRGSIDSPAIEAAFRCVPRHLFVDHFYMRDKESRILRWKHVTLDTLGDIEQWLSLIYRNKPLITSVNAIGQPDGSSSAPGAMAAMLEPLDMQPGMRVLEIGTGTGYNAAVLAHLAGNPHLVFTIDLFPELVAKAQESLDRVVGPGVITRVANGLDGYPPAAPYDRIIATASWYRVPLSWLYQLQHDGVLVMNLKGRLGWGCFLRVTKTGQGRAAHGTITGFSDFMILQEPGSAAIGFPSLIPHYVGRPINERISFSESEFNPRALDSTSLLFLLQLSFHQLYYGWIQLPADTPPSLCLIDTVTETLLKFCSTEENWSVEIRGEVQVWQRLKQIFQHWETLGHPDITAYELEIEETGQQFVCLPHRPDARWAL